MLEKLDEKEARVIGCLIEKSITTPDQYPLTLNALTSGDPVAEVDRQQQANRQDGGKEDLHPGERAVGGLTVAGWLVIVHVRMIARNRSGRYRSITQDAFLIKKHPPRLVSVSVPKVGVEPTLP